MKTAISIPDPLFNMAESFAQHLGISRNELFAKALTAYLETNSNSQNESITIALNNLYAEEPSSLDPVLQQVQLTSLNQEEW